ncbi:MAG: uroporphyrinogen decarboxylase [Candidatus Pacebacteria bacterium]|nr:uroporphyrinogen decarboxylase [Candidatus Paceibacterota bacterium]
MEKNEESLKNPIRQNRPLLDCLNGFAGDKIPFWFMRQAGRYLPEYRAIRSQEKNFIQLCLNPDLASEITLQPIRRFDMDGAILFSDILIVPHVLGQRVEFIESIGPRLKPLRSLEDLKILNLESVAHGFDPIYQTVKLTCQGLPANKTMIGFCGGIWTVASYMIEGQSSKNYETIKQHCYQNSEFINRLFAILIEASYHYLVGQIEAGCQVIQIFESWAGQMDEFHFNKFILDPTEILVNRLRASHPEIPIIWFPKNASETLIQSGKILNIQAIGLDSTVTQNTARQLQKHYVIQGYLDPIYLLTDPKTIEAATRRMIESVRLDSKNNSRYIFNLGHGILPNSPVENVAFLVQLLKSI